MGTLIASVAGPLIGGVLGAKASKSAANTQAAATDRATESQREMFDKQVELQEPFRQGGLSANNRLLQLLGLSEGGDGNGSLMQDFSMADFEADPGYAFRMSEGTKAIEGGAAARGGLLSGAAQKALQKYGQESASQEYGNAFNRFTTQKVNKSNLLAGVVNTGQGATNQVSNAAGQFGQQQASNIIGAGNAQAAGQIGSANALVGGINGGINSYQNNQLMNMIRNPGASTMRPASSEAYYGY